MNPWSSLVLIAVTGVVTCSANAGDAVPGQSEFNALQEKYNVRAMRSDSAIEGAKDEEERTRLLHLHPAHTMVPDFLDFERRHRGELTGLSALHHLVALAFAGYGGNPEYAVTEGGRKAIAVLASHYGDHKDLDLFFFFLRAGLGAAESKMLLRRALDSPHRHVRGNAALRLAEIFGSESEFALWWDENLELVRDDPSQVERAKLFRGLQRRFSDVDIRASRSEAIKFCDQVLAEYADVLESPRTTYGPVILEIKREVDDPLTNSPRRKLLEMGQSLRFRLLNLSIGQASPEIQGLDAFGSHLKLSDHRGKVTVVMFSFKGCLPCEAMYSTNRHLVEEYRDRPFAFVGVMGDEKLETVRESVNRGAITWPVWWDGGKRGPIHTQWNVDAWPEIYVMDHRGIIRYRELDSDLLELAVAKLVAEAEAAD